jgi:hypothetical protein
MSDWLMRVIKAEATRLIELAALDNELRADLRALAEAILAATEGQGVKSNDAPSASPSVPKQASIAAAAVTKSPAAHGVAQSDAEQTAEPLRELTLGRSALSTSNPRSLSTATPQPRTTHDDLVELDARCRRKSEAARWAAERLRRIREGKGFQIENPLLDRDMVEWADRLTDCFYWMKSSESSEQADLGLLDDVGGCFESVAESLALVRALLEKRSGGPRILERALPLVTEAQSALRAAFQRLGAPDDPEQLEVFEWLKSTAARNHVYIKRYMRAGDSADPARWSDLLARIESLATSGQLSRQHSSRIEQLTDCVTRIQAGEGSDHDWQAIIKTVDEMVGEGVPPSNREIRELLLPVLEDIPERDDLPDGLELVLREIDRFLATRPAEARPSVSHEPSALVKEVARLLGGQCIVLIGGNRRREAQESLRVALGLADLIWIETKEHQAVDAFAPMIARPDVALVLLAIRWSSHAFGDVKRFCDRYGKPLVRLPGGYSPNQVAAQIRSQCSGQIEERSQIPG